MNRRDFLRGMAGILATGFAPAVVGSGVLMPVRTILTIDPIPWSGRRMQALLDQLEWANQEVQRICGLEAMIYGYAYMKVKYISMDEMKRRYPPCPS